MNKRQKEQEEIEIKLNKLGSGKYATRAEKINKKDINNDTKQTCGKVH